MENKLFDYFKDKFNSDFFDITDLLIVCQVYLNTIRDFPDMVI